MSRPEQSAMKKRSPFVFEKKKTRARKVCTDDNSAGNELLDDNGLNANLIIGDHCFDSTRLEKH